MTSSNLDLEAFVLESLLLTWASETGKPVVKAQIPQHHYYENTKVISYNHRNHKLTFVMRILRPTATGKCEGSVNVGFDTRTLWTMNFSGKCSHDAIPHLKMFHKQGFGADRFLFAYNQTRLSNGELLYVSRPKPETDFNRFEGTETITHHGKKVLYFRYEGRLVASQSLFSELVQKAG